MVNKTAVEGIRIAMWSMESAAQRWKKMSDQWNISPTPSVVCYCKLLI